MYAGNTDLCIRYRLRKASVAAMLVSWEAAHGRR
jgi:hypothetical protein